MTTYNHPIPMLDRVKAEDLQEILRLVLYHLGLEAWEGNHAGYREVFLARVGEAP